MNTKLSIVFFGSGPVALKSLQLLADDFDIEAIVTKPATETVMRSSFTGTPLFVVKNQAELDTLCMEQQFQSRVGILIDFGIIVSQRVIDAFPLGIINSHFSLLPEWRGADPITFSILSGQAQTGVSLMLLVAAMDEGPLLAQAPFTIDAGATTPSLTANLIELSSSMLKAIVPEYLADHLSPAPQENVSIAQSKSPTYSRKLTKADGRLDWQKPAATLEREIRAYIEWPHSYTILAGRDVIITQAQVHDGHGEPGTVAIEGKRLIIYCGAQALEILRLKPAGKPEMAADAFLAGYGRLL